MTEQLYNNKNHAFAGYISIVGAVSMCIGAAFWGASGTDLWQTLANNQMAGYLEKLGPVKNLLVAGTMFWTLGVLLMGTAGAFMSSFNISNQRWAQVQLVVLQTSIPVAIVSFFVMLSLAFQQPDVNCASTLGWIGARLDDLATILIIGVSPFLLSISGRKDWVPSWLLIWGYLAGLTGLMSIVSMLTGMVALGFIIIPFGIGWMIAAGVVLIKKR